MKRVIAAAGAIGLGLTPISLPAQEMDAAEAQSEVSPALSQLRHIIGEWDVATTFYRPGGTPGPTLDGTYRFSWVMEDRIVQGMSTIPQLEMASGLLFYLRDATSEIEMVSVGPDGQLWTMTGPQDSEIRETPVVEMPNGSTLKLRFTRFNVSDDRFESRMDRSTDGGQTWEQGNHQLFVRKDPAAELGRGVAGERVLRQEVIVDTGLATAWDLFTDKSAIERWMAPVAKVDLSNAGRIRTHYDACAAVGDPGTIELRIINLIPRKMLTLQAVLPDDPRPEWMNETVFAARDRLTNVVEFEPLSDGRTRITSWGLGYGDGPEWDQMIDFFTRGNAWSFAQLQKAVGGERVTPTCEN